MKMFYKVQLPASQPVASYIHQCKLYIQQRAGKFKFITSDAHISLFSFEADVADEQQLIKALRKASTYLDTFDVSLNGFSHFPQSRTLFIKVENARLLKERNRLFHDAFLSITKDMGIDISNMTFTDHPHMTIGADFDSKIYGSLYNAFVQHRYHQDFKAESALLVKYIGRGKNKVLSKAPFQKVSKHHPPFNEAPTASNEKGQMTLEFN
ncbi:MAG: 2'-5' RNA ligase family protein [Imperialibacter sp.]